MDAACHSQRARICRRAYFFWAYGGRCLINRSAWRPSSVYAQHGQHRLCHIHECRRTARAPCPGLPPWRIALVCGTSLWRSRRPLGIGQWGGRFCSGHDGKWLDNHIRGWAEYRCLKSRLGRHCRCAFSCHPAQMSSIGARVVRPGSWPFMVSSGSCRG